jgi:bifunctional non-homologous end joining protein LigD
LGVDLVPDPHTYAETQQNRFSGKAPVCRTYDARAVQQLPEGKDWVYEVKCDGYRCLAGKDSTGVTLWSRRGNRFTDQFPTIAKACEHLPPDTLLDGEIIALDAKGRVSFNQLQHHRSQAQAILYYASTW